MYGSSAPSAAANVWPRLTGATATGPVPLGGGSTGLPIVTNPNLPSNSMMGAGNLPPLVSQPPRTPFPSIRQPFGPTNSLASNNYATGNFFPPTNPMAGSLAPNPAQTAQNQAYQQRLMQLEEENNQRRLATANLTQLGTHVLQGQMDVQDQVLQYQYMLEQCMETLDNQNFILNEQAEELALLRSKMRHFEYLMDAYRLSKEGSHRLQSMCRDSYDDDNSLLCCGDPISLPPPSTSPFFAGGPTRVTASTFQPFNPRYRSPNSRASTAMHLNEHRNVSPTVSNRNLPTANNRPSRRLVNVN